VVVKDNVINRRDYVKEINCRDVSISDLHR
jgi:hypothetical protein